MPTTRVITPLSRVRFGVSRVDITPPVGIYNRMWGAARQDRAMGVHRPLSAEVMAFGPAADPDSAPLIRVQLDWVGIGTAEQQKDIVQAVTEAGGVFADWVLVGVSHSHAVGLFTPNRFEKQGGELIGPYLEDVRGKLKIACREALDGMQEVILTYGTGRCELAGNRDYWDDEYGGFTCGFNPDEPADDTVMVVRATDSSGRQIASIVNYGCHPTTLAWENTLISPDFVGALREVVEAATDSPCIFAQGASGDLGPRRGFVADTQVADQNGRQLGYAALSAMMAMGAPGTEFVYQGPVVSGATLGTWGDTSIADDRNDSVSKFSGGVDVVNLPYKELPKQPDLKREIEEWQTKLTDAEAAGNAADIRDFGARAERALRWLGRLEGLPKGETYPMPFSVFRMGDAIWVTTAGEPYNVLQVELRKRFPEFAIVFSPLVGVMNVSYLLPKDRYGKGLYQEEPAVLAPGCLETLIEAISDKIDAVVQG